MNKKRNALIAGMLIIALLISVFPPHTAEAKIAEGQTFAKVTFDNYPAEPSSSAPAAEIGGTWGVYNYNVTGDVYGHYLQGETVEPRTDRSLKMVSGLSGQTMYIAKNNMGLNGIVVLEASVRFNDTLHDRQAFQLKSLSGKFANMVVFGGNGRAKLLGGTMFDYEPHSWYFIRIVIDNPGRTADIYVNEELKEAGVPVDAAWDKLNNVKFQQTGTESAVGEMWIDDIRIYEQLEQIDPVENIALPSAAKVAEGDTVSLRPRSIAVPPDNAGFAWSSSDPDIASVDENGIVYGRRSGQATITTVWDHGEQSAHTEITVFRDESAEWDDYRRLRQKWTVILLNGVPYTGSDPETARLTKEKIESVNREAVQWWESMNVYEQRSTLWDDARIPADLKTSDFLAQWSNRLRTMATAYAMQGGVLYHNAVLWDDMIAALDWMHDNVYRDSGEIYGNWWNWEIGAPLRLADMYILLADELDAERIGKYARSIHHYIGDVTSPSFRHVGANRSDILLIELLLGLVERNGKRLSDVREQMSPLFEYVTSGDGFYEDGSFIQHKTIAYTGSYGEVLIRGVGNLLYLLNDSPWEIVDPNADNVYRWIYESFAPIIYKGEVMDMVRGRAIARDFLDGYKAASGMMSGIVQLARIAPDHHAQRLKGLVKYWIASNPGIHDVNRIFDNTEQIETVKGWLADSTVVPQGDEPGHFELNAMNRSVHKGEGYAFGVSKSSKRIWTYELTNGENRKGWYTGDGMTYLYNGDAMHYSDDFWSTVDYYRLPGVTLNTRERDSSQYQYGDGEGAPANNWAGGVTLDKYGTSGMNLRQIGTTLTANKSWFMFDDEIVALGSGITSEDRENIETIVEQRKLSAEGTNVVTVDGVPQPVAPGRSDGQAANWAHLAGHMPNSDIGYYFPERQTLHMLRERRSGTWFDINRNENGDAGGPQDVRTRDYMTMWFDHGVRPRNQTYSYVLLPNKTAEETERYAANPDIEIVANTADVHAVRERKLGLTGVNFWSAAGGKADFAASNRQASLMIGEHDDDTLAVAVADPTLENTGVIEIELDRSAAGVVSADPEIFVTQLSPTIRFQANVNGSLGRSFNAVFDLDPDKPRPEPERPLPEPGNEPEPLPDPPPIAYIYDHFDDQTEGNIPEGWKASIAPDTTASLQQPAGRDGLYFRLLDRNASGGSVSAERNFEPQSGKLEVEWKFAEPEGAASSTFELLDGNNVAVQLVSDEEGLQWVGPDGCKHPIRALAPATWYKVKLRLDPARGSFDVYVDNELAATDAQFRNGTNSIGAIRFATTPAASRASLYVDDVIVYVTGAKSFVYETFNGYETGTKPASWTIAEQTDATVAIADEPSAANRSLLLDDNNAKFSAKASKSFPSQNDRIVAEWKFKEGTSGKWPVFELTNGKDPVITLKSNGQYLKYIDPDGGIVDLIKFAHNVWYSVKLDANIAENTFDLYLDGALLERSLPFTQPSAAIDGIAFTTSYGAVNAPLYIDDVKIYGFERQVERITVVPSNANLRVGDTLALKAEADPADAVNAQYVWESLQPAIANVDDQGLVTALAPGTAKIIVRTEDRRERAESVITVTGNEKPGDGGGNGEGGSGGGSGGNSRNDDKPDNMSANIDQQAGKSEEDEDGNADSGERGTDNSGEEESATKGDQDAAIRDIAGHWAEETIRRSIEAGWMNGYPDGSFRPDRAMTRAEFAVLIVRVLGLAPRSGPAFADLNGHWSAELVGTAAAHGIVNGVSDTSFAPDEPVTREQMALMAFRAFPIESASGMRPFQDSGQIAEWAGEAVASLTAADVLQGFEDGTFRPKRRGTRAEAVVLTERIFKAVPAGS
ncbi:polysaccharide lyase family 8 super-sandwich domain-containing protein [Paenibacillus sp. MSJ-34]|uniref:polysaccharide lyase family 8 super-sandwich domain-containing protein n=1 Tax=Paenibacillus sp. MSJ-34 TaxID=2841529 RepID=UPI001C0FD807|nr:polysaccharide lyase family 8 super-sandwich domain-containing protein [Paenibacillus sp. MSJ-34]MBU5442230.1 S-layer homology domain-containing protein [Paenibacillus sp. MSJ-34]